MPALLGADGFQGGSHIAWRLCRCVLHRSSGLLVDGPQPLEFTVGTAAEQHSRRVVALPPTHPRTDRTQTGRLAYATLQDLLTAMVCGHMYHDRCIGAMSTAEKKHMRELTCCVCKTLNTPVDIGSKEFPLVLSPSPHVPVEQLRRASSGTPRLVARLSFAQSLILKHSGPNSGPIAQVRHNRSLLHHPVAA